MRYILLLSVCLLVGCNTEPSKMDNKVVVTFLDGTKDTLYVRESFSISRDDELYTWCSNSNIRTIAKQVKSVKPIN